MASDRRKLTQEELLALLRERFGPDPMDWAFRCPSCGDVATARDFTEALTARPRKNRDGSTATASDVIGQECIGRTLGALDREKPAGLRGCDWCAYGLFPGPWEVTLPGGGSMRAFPVAPAPEEARHG